MATRARGRARSLRAELELFARGARSGLEQVHDLHRRLRRTRQEARLLGRSEGPAALRDLERALGQWRDLTLFRAILRSAEPSALSERERLWRKAAYARCRAEEARAGRAALALGHEAALAARARGTGRPASFDGAERLRETQRAVRDALRRARDRLTPRRAHALRKELRRLGFLSDLEAARRRQRAPDRPRSVRRLVSVLGRMHDLDVALERLARYPKGGARWVRRLLRERRRQEPSVRRALSSKALRRYVRGAA